tara:strand:- start:37 stop:288 length:252 start_codon:yes stop_codon:yes gene_type:complete
MIIDKATAIKEINPNAEFTISNDNYSELEWLNGTTPISESEIDAKIIELKKNGTIEENKKTSGKQKLKDLGLDDDEITALLGV